MPDYQSVDIWGDRLQETRIENHRSVCAYCHVMTRRRAAKAAAVKLMQSEDWVRRAARIHERWHRELEYPVAFNVYETAIKADDPEHALRLAIDPEYREECLGEDDGQNIWSARTLQDHLDMRQGKRQSRVRLTNHEADVVAWEGGTIDGYPVARIELDVPDFEPSGEPPRKVKVITYEVLAE